MGRPRTFDDQAVVRAARELFWERGYAATSLAQLQEATQLSRSSMYATYGSKRGLFARASQHYLDEVVEPLLAPMERPGAGAAELEIFFLTMASVLRNPDERLARRGCFILNTALELDELDAEAAEMVGAYRARVHRAIANALTDVDGVDDRAARAEALTVAHVGVMITARIAPLAAAAASESFAAEFADLVS